MHDVQPEDEGLLQAVAAWNPHAIDQLYGKYGGMLFGFLLTTIKNRSVAEEILQDIFMELPDTLHSYNPQYLRFYSFLVQKAREKARQWHINQQSDEDENLPVLFESSSHAASLSPEEQEVFNLCYYNGFTMEDIAARKNWAPEEAQLRCRAIFAKVHIAVSGTASSDN
ncbi:MAG: sigma factor [Chitinophagaceae bacterium]